MLSRLNRAMPTNAGTAVDAARPRTRGVTPFALQGLLSTQGVNVLDSDLRPTDSAGGGTG